MTEHLAFKNKLPEMRKSPLLAISKLSKKALNPKGKWSPVVWERHGAVARSPFRANSKRNDIGTPTFIFTTWSFIEQTNMISPLV